MEPTFPCLTHRCSPGSSPQPSSEEAVRTICGRKGRSNESILPPKTTQNIAKLNNAVLIKSSLSVVSSGNFLPCVQLLRDVPVQVHAHTQHVLRQDRPLAVSSPVVLGMS